MNTRISLIAALSVIVLSFTLQAQPGGKAGAYTRMGFGARGMGMGNAMTAVNKGVISPYYNPALAAFQIGHVLHGSYSILALDRQLNQVSYTQRLAIPKEGANKFKENPNVQSFAGFSVGWINAGDGDIQGYDSDGFKTEMLGVFDNQFSLTLANRFSERLAIGFGFKFYYSKLYDDTPNGPPGVTSSGFGFDIGLLYTVSDQLNIALVAQEILTTYKWDTSVLYGPENGRSTDDPFVRIFRLGAAYTLESGFATIAADVESWDSDYYFGRAGVEAHLHEQFTLRAGVERLDFSDAGVDPRPSVGFTVTQPVGTFLPSVNYAFVLEPVAPSPTHVLSIGLSF